MEAMTRARAKEERKHRRQGAAEVIAIVSGFRGKRFNARQVFRDLSGEGRGASDRAQRGKFYQESRERARKANPKAFEEREQKLREAAREEAAARAREEQEAEQAARAESRRRGVRKAAGGGSGASGVNRSRRGGRGRSR